MLFINSSIIDKKAERDDIRVYYVPCNEIAEELGNGRVANMVMLGAYIAKTKCVDIENVLAALLNKLGEKKAHLIPLNREALLKGAAAVE
jgi:2-oxoglutarate ferredoxin oxidoreductase subunit gamma